jgi:hypothetical protein
MDFGKVFRVPRSIHWNALEDCSLHNVLVSALRISSGNAYEYREHRENEDKDTCLCIPGKASW